MKFLYGPVASWRLGRSLGVDIISTKEKTCSFDCVYCQLGKTINKTAERRIFIKTEEVEKEIVEVADKNDIDADVITFSGVGEPTLGANLGEVADVIRDNTKIPIAILTNSSLMADEEVRDELKRMDIVLAKLDASNQRVFERINKPIKNINDELAEIIRGIKDFRKEYTGKLCLQMMFIEENKWNASDMAKIAKDIGADEIQINTPLRPCAVKPLPREDLEIIEGYFKGLNAVSVYKSEKPQVSVMDKVEVMRRRNIAD